MTAATPCPCSSVRPHPSVRSGCARCDGESLTPVVVWGEDATPSHRPPPRTDPPRHAEAAALELYGRVAARAVPQYRRRFRMRGIAAGLALLAAAAVVYRGEWDVALLRLGTVALAFTGLISLLKGLLGHGPTR